MTYVALGMVNWQQRRSCRVTRSGWLKENGKVTTQAQRPGARDATMATATLTPAARGKAAAQFCVRRSYSSIPLRRSRFGIRSARMP